MKKTIWAPIIIGLAAGGLSYVTLVVDFKIAFPLSGGTNANMGVTEIFGSLAAALGGPIAVVITSLLNDAGGYLIIREVFPWPTSFYVTGADAAAHMVAMLAAAFCYRFLHERTKTKLFALIAGWVLIVANYYFVILTPMQVFLINMFVPGFGTYMELVSATWPEFLATSIVTSLIWVALPMRNRKPLWYDKPQPATSPVETTA